MRYFYNARQYLVRENKSKHNFLIQTKRVRFCTINFSRELLTHELKFRYFHYLEIIISAFKILQSIDFVNASTLKKHDNIFQVSYIYFRSQIYIEHLKSVSKINSSVKPTDRRALVFKIWYKFFCLLFVLELIVVSLIKDIDVVVS